MQLNFLHNTQFFAETCNRGIYYTCILLPNGFILTKKYVSLSKHIIERNSDEKFCLSFLIQSNEKTGWDVLTNPLPILVHNGTQ